MLPYSILHPFLSFGNVKDLKIVVGTNPSPPPGRRWLFLCGIMNHINGTASSLNIANKNNSQNYGNVGFVDSALASNPYPIPNIPIVEAVSATAALVTNNDHPLVSPFVIIDDEHILALSGGTGANANIMVLEVVDYKIFESGGFEGSLPSAPSSPLGPQQPIIQTSGGSGFKR